VQKRGENSFYLAVKTALIIFITTNRGFFTPRPIQCFYPQSLLCKNSFMVIGVRQGKQHE
jgi:hypothetical protein